MPDNHTKTRIQPPPIQGGFFIPVIAFRGGKMYDFPHTGIVITS